MDPLMLLFLLIAGLTGADSVSSVRSVTAQRGGSVTIPCPYDGRYESHVKYWCRGSVWGSCTTIVRTDFPQKKGEVSIRDDPDQRVFTVTMDNLETGGSDIYWCCVEVTGTDVGDQVYLSVTEAVSTMSTVFVQSGGSVTIPCFYSNMYQHQEKYWCNGSDWSSCTPIVRTNSPKKSAEVSIRDDPGQRLFTVIMNNLKIVDSGYYWCGVEIIGGSAVGTRVSLSVTEGVSTLNTVTVERGGSVTIPCFYDNEYRQQVKYWCKGIDWSSCTPIIRTDSPKKSEVSIRDDPVKRVFNVTMNYLTTGNSGYYWCGVEINRGSAVGTRVSLSVTEGVFTLNTVTVERGGSVTIPCFYDNKYRQYVKYWCKGSDLSSCTPIIRTDSPKMKDEVSITNDPAKQVFNVTMNNLTAVDSGYYWCGVETNRSSAVGTRVYLSVTGWIIEKQSLFLYVGLGLSVLLLIIIIIITWKVCDKHKKKRAMNQNPGSTELTLNPEHEFAVIDRTGIIKGDPLEQQVSSRCSSHHSVVSSSKSVVYSSFTLKHIEGPP